MSKARVPLFQQPRNFVDITPEATIGATIGVNLFNRDGSLFDINSLNTSSDGTTIINGEAYVNIKDASTSRIISANDHHKIIEFTNASAITITIDGSVPMNEMEFYVFYSNTGVPTAVGANGMVIECDGAFKPRAPYALIGFRLEEPLQMLLFGDYETIAPAVSVLGRSANSVGAPDYIVASTNGHFFGRQSNVVGFFPVPPPTPLDTTLTYNIDGTLDVVTTASGTKTMGYTLGKLTSIVGTGIYPSKNFTYTGDDLTGIDVL